MENVTYKRQSFAVMDASSLFCYIYFSNYKLAIQFFIPVTTTSQNMSNFSKLEKAQGHNE